jgi:hypothetical protein
MGIMKLGRFPTLKVRTSFAGSKKRQIGKYLFVIKDANV